MGTANGGFGSLSSWPSTEQNHCAQQSPTELPLPGLAGSLSPLETYSRAPGSLPQQQRSALSLSHYPTVDWADRSPWLSWPQWLSSLRDRSDTVASVSLSHEAAEIGDTRVTGDVGPQGALRHTAEHSTPSCNCLGKDITEITCTHNCCCRCHCSDQH